MSEPILFHTDLYRRDAVELAAQQFEGKARIVLGDRAPYVVAHLEPLPGADDWQAVRDGFCNAAFTATARQLREPNAAGAQGSGGPASDLPPWELLAPLGEGSELGLGWAIESLSPVRGGVATLLLRHADHGPPRVCLRRNAGAPLGIAHTDHLDFMLMNGGSGAAQTEESIGRVLIHFAQTYARYSPGAPAARLAGLEPHSEGQAPSGSMATNPTGLAHDRVAPRIDLADRTSSSTSTTQGSTGSSCMMPWWRCRALPRVLTRPGAHRLNVQVRPPRAGFAG
jgi:hypothetical protein